MTKLLGDTIKEIRCGKNISQNELCKDIVSRTYLSKIEHNLSYPTFYNLKKLISNLDLSLSEFDYLLVENNQKDKIINSFWRIKDDSKKEQLKKLIRYCKEYPINDSLITDIGIICEVMLSFPELNNGINNCKNKIKISKVWARLNRMDLWTLNELKLASCCLFYFPIETASKIAQRIQKNLIYYENYDSNDIQIFIIGQYINLTTLYINNKQFDLASKTNCLALKLSLDNHRYDFYYLCFAREGILKDNIKMITNGIHILEELNLPEYVKSIKSELNVQKIKL